MKVRIVNELAHSPTGIFVGTLEAAEDLLALIVRDYEMEGFKVDSIAADGSTQRRFRVRDSASRPVGVYYIEATE